MGILDDVFDVVFTPNLLGLTDISLEDFGDSLGGGDKKKAADAQARAAAEGNATQLHMYNQTRADQEPWRQAGTTALTGMQDPKFQRDFGAADFKKDPGYDFRMKEGTKAIEASAAARGGLNSGANMKALARFGQDTASAEYQNAYNRFNTNQTNRFNRLSSLAGTGQTATNQVQAAGTNYANQVNANQVGVGNARAAAITGQGDMYRDYAQMGMSAFAMCDSREKTSIETFNERELLEPLTAYTYEYSNEQNGKGRHVGIMAQDLMKSPIGSEYVVVEDGKMLVDYGRMVPALLATIVKLNQRISRLEEERAA